MKRNHKNLSLNLHGSSKHNDSLPATTAYQTKTTQSHSNESQNTTTHRTAHANPHNQQPPHPTPPAQRLYQHGPAEILPYLFLGACHTVEKTMLASLGIACILNVAHEIEPPSTLHTSTLYYHLRWTHTQPNLGRREFHRAIRVLRDNISQKKKVLVHCQSGIERSAALVIAYIVSFTKKSVEEAVDYVRARAPGIRPNLALMYQLSEFEALMHNNNRTQTRRLSLSSAHHAPQFLHVPHNHTTATHVLAQQVQHKEIERRPRATSCAYQHSRTKKPASPSCIPSPGTPLVPLRLPPSPSSHSTTVAFSEPALLLVCVCLAALAIVYFTAVQPDLGAQTTVRLSTNHHPPKQLVSPCTCSTTPAVMLS
ncbi:protein-tyrosine phosphatase-like protein [Syncephalastrum racemosum]|uniref:protein-tyrosine-phosphatase n=1 Tax=Syncephalastrum racemosum TaxID=13706 RepID=A0A1X2HWL7_SYNRA|nr:protein-tyrosine phosphatase-like protein [Syncephalastrum racemosum]